MPTRYRLSVLLVMGLLLSPTVASAQHDEVQVAGRTLAGWVRDLDDDNEIVRLRAVKSLGPFGVQAVNALTEALDDSSAGVRYWAASHLGAVGVEASSAKNRLLELKADEDHPGVQMAAAFALCRIDDVEPHVGLLIERLDYPERGMACSAAEFLGRLGKDGVVAMPALERAFHAHAKGANPIRKPNPDYHVHGACQNALRQIDPDWKPTPPTQQADK